MRKFIAGLVLGIVLTGAVAVWLLVKMDAQPLIFPRKEFYFVNQSSGQGYMRASGSIAGSEVGNPNNVFSVECVQASGRCTVIDFSQIGPRQIGALNVSSWPIERWTPDQILVRNPPGQPVCVRVTLVIQRQAQAIHYIREPLPQNRGQPGCENTDRRTFRWTIEDSPFRRERGQ